MVSPHGGWLNTVFYFIKPILPRALQLAARRARARYKQKRYADVWPIDPRSATPPPGWKGWPAGKKFAFVLQHDVDTQKGHDACRQLMDLEENLGVRSTFFVVPERYRVSLALLDEIKQRGFGLGVHGLKHDGKLFLSEKIFRKRAGEINGYLQSWGARGFSSPSMLHRLDWMHYLDIDYSTSTFDTDPIEPQPDAAGTIFPFYCTSPNSVKGFVEMPYTLAQDFTVFVILRETTIGIWSEKLDWIAQNGGMALLNTHPDYMDFTNEPRPGREEYPVRLYVQFISYVKERHADEYWSPLSKDLAANLLRPSD